jgi:hypothetical protein
MSVACEFCMFSVRRFCVRPILRPEQPTECGMRACHLVLPSAIITLHTCSV